jgi:hypothetical protein
MQDRIKVKVDGNDQEVFMSFGLLSELAGVVGSPENITALSVIQGMREEVIRLALSDRKKRGQIVEDKPAPELSIEDGEKLLAFISEHVMGFFVRTLQATTEIVKKNQQALESLASSSDGLRDSLSKKPSSGPSAPAN